MLAGWQTACSRATDSAHGDLVSRKDELSYDFARRTSKATAVPTLKAKAWCLSVTENLIPHRPSATLVVKSIFTEIDPKYAGTTSS